MLPNFLHQHACCKVWALTLLLAAPGLAAAPAHTDGRWVFENDTLRVSVSDAEPVWDVFDKRSNRLWRQAREPEGTQWVVPVRRAAATPTLNGQLQEWGGDGIIVNSKLATASTATSEEDCSARFHFAWDNAGCWLAADVTDDRRSGLVAGAKLWHVDSVELWLGTEHWGFVPDGNEARIACWSNPAMAEGCRAAARPTETGWQLEAFVPWSRVVGFGADARAGRQVMLAFGVDESLHASIRPVEAGHVAEAGAHICRPPTRHTRPPRPGEAHERTGTWHALHRRRGTHSC